MVRPGGGPPTGGSGAPAAKGSGPGGPPTGGSGAPAAKGSGPGRPPGAPAANRSQAGCSQYIPPLATATVARPSSRLNPTALRIRASSRAPSCQSSASTAILSAR